MPDDAMRATEDDNKTLKNVLPKVFAGPDPDKKVPGEVVDLFANNLRMDGTEDDRDLPSRICEYGDFSQGWENGMNLSIDKPQMIIII